MPLLKPALIWTRFTSVDEELCQFMELDPFTLSRMRKLFIQQYHCLSQSSRKELAETNMSQRFALLHQRVKAVLTESQYEHWLHFLEVSNQDVEDMINDKLVVGDFPIRRLSAMFGIKGDFIRGGDAPKPEPQPCIAILVEAQDS